MSPLRVTRVSSVGDPVMRKLAALIKNNKMDDTLIVLHLHQPEVAATMQVSKTHV